ncbi:hypothetical protein [Marixanthomonas spongiae]|uniref:Uncharacterized protein n=1 Tax=Marixanthomonas spongiae TaxID=2174845 RepID=A0A2U0I2A7_9FLAO|nr:hypothetical protein [Marixanthomonas spongiae]PVW15237.1 hypothetical protein DDV96_07475 [Marixanthomonas spongiae]
MTHDDNKYYILKIKYSVQEISGKKKHTKRPIHKNKKRYLIKDLHSLDRKFEDIEHTLTEVDKPDKKNIFNILKNYVLRFGSNCNSTYHRMLRI